MTRLETLHKYLAEAELHPKANRLYIEDLKISIEYENSKNRQKEILMLEEIIIGCTKEALGMLLQFCFR